MVAMAMKSVAHLLIAKLDESLHKSVSQTEQCLTLSFKAEHTEAVPNCVVHEPVVKILFMIWTLCFITSQLTADLFNFLNCENVAIIINIVQLRLFFLPLITFFQQTLLTPMEFTSEHSCYIYISKIVQRNNYIFTSISISFGSSQALGKEHL